MSPFLTGFVILGLGIAGRVYVARRRFYRRNIAGIEEFAGFGRMVVTRFAEGVINLAAWVTIFAGAVCLLTMTVHRQSVSRGPASQVTPTPRAPLHATRTKASI